MNRTVQRIFLPNGVWYDFKTGKKYIGGKRYVSFFKDEDYPVFAKKGTIIPLGNDWMIKI
jgi:alpha-D-xyloside xylohydrolase